MTNPPCFLRCCMPCRVLWLLRMTWWRISGPPQMTLPLLRPQPLPPARRAFGGGWTIRRSSISRNGKASRITTCNGKPACLATSPVPLPHTKLRIGELRQQRISLCQQCSLSSKYGRPKPCLLQSQKRLVWMITQVLRKTLPAMRRQRIPMRLPFNQEMGRLQRMKPGLRFLLTGRNASP